MAAKPKVGFYWCSSCGGCEESIVDLAEEMFRQMRQMSNYSEIRDQVQGNRAENRPPDYTAIGRQKSVIKISLEILGSRDEEQLEADVREVLNRMIDLVSADEGTVDLFIDKGESYARYDAPIKEEQEQVEARLAATIEERDRELRADPDFKTVGHLEAGIVGRLKEKVAQWREESDVPIVFVGPELNSSGMWMLQRLTGLDDWNAPMREGGLAEVHFLESHDPSGVKRLMKKVEGAQKVRVVQVGPQRIRADETINAVEAAFDGEVVREPVNKDLWNENTLMLATAGLVNPDAVDLIYEGAREDHIEWRKLEFEDAEAKQKYAAYEFTILQLRHALTGTNVPIFAIFSTVILTLFIWGDEPIKFFGSPCSFSNL